MKQSEKKIEISESVKKEPKKYQYLIYDAYHDEKLPGQIDFRIEEQIYGDNH